MYKTITLDSSIPCMSKQSEFLKAAVSLCCMAHSCSHHYHDHSKDKATKNRDLCSVLVRKGHKNSQASLGFVTTHSYLSINFVSLYSHLTGMHNALAMWSIQAVGIVLPLFSYGAEISPCSITALY